MRGQGEHVERDCQLSRRQVGDLSAAVRQMIGGVFPSSRKGTSVPREPLAAQHLDKFRLAFARNAGDADDEYTCPRSFCSIEHGYGA